MSKKNLIVSILAAGRGSRIKGTTPKVLLKINGKTLIQNAIELAENFSKDINIIISEKLSFLKKNFSKYNFFIQKNFRNRSCSKYFCQKKKV